MPIFILGLLEKNPTIANTVILLHPSNLGYQYVSGEFATKVIVTTGAQDELSIPGQVLSLANQLKKHFPVDFLLVDGGHGLSEEEVTKIKRSSLKTSCNLLLISGCSLFFSCVKLKK